MAVAAIHHLFHRVGVVLRLVESDAPTSAAVGLAVPGGQIADPALSTTGQVDKPKPETPDAVMHGSYIRRHYACVFTSGKVTSLSLLIPLFHSSRKHVASVLKPFSNLPRYVRRLASS